MYVLFQALSSILDPSKVILPEVSSFMVKNEPFLPSETAAKARRSVGPTDAPALSAAASSYVCEQCGFSSNKRSAVTRHVKAEHEKGALPSRQVTLLAQPEYCPGVRTNSRYHPYTLLYVL